MYTLSLISLLVKLKLENKNQLLNEVTNKYNTLLKVYKKTRKDIFAFSASLQNLTEEFNKKMKHLSEDSKEKIGIKQRLDHEYNRQINTSNSKNIVSITSNLWQTVMLITNGIETSLNACEDITEFSDISSRDYNLKNSFEIYHPSL